MDKQNYKPRVIDAKVKEYLSAFGAVCIEGPKWCGKTWTSSYHSKSEIYIGDPANNFQNRQLAELSPALAYCSFLNISTLHRKALRLSRGIFPSRCSRSP